MSEIIIYTKAACPYCLWAKKFLDNRQLAYQEIRVDLDSTAYEKMKHLSGKHTVPQIFIDNQAIGGYDDLIELAKKGELELLLR